MPLYYASLGGFRALTEHLPVHETSMAGAVLIRPQSRVIYRSHHFSEIMPIPILVTISTGFQVSQGGLVAKSSLEIARLLINSGADVIKGCASLHTAAQSGYREIAELLLGSI
jgi:hypothetical protein